MVRQQLESLDVFLPRLLDDILRNFDIFLCLETVCDKPIPEILLVKAVLAPPDLVTRSGPEARAIGRQDLVDEHHLVRLLIDTKLEFGVCYNDTAISCMFLRLATLSV